MSLGESWLVCWAEASASRNPASLGYVIYESSLAKVSPWFTSKLRSADTLQQGLQGGGGLLCFSSLTPLLEALLGLGLGLGLAVLLASKAPRH